MSTLKLYTQIAKSAFNNGILRTHIYCMRTVPSFAQNVARSNNNKATTTRWYSALQNSHRSWCGSGATSLCGIQAPAAITISQQQNFGKNHPDQTGKSESKASAAVTDDIFGEASKLGLFAKFRLMYKKYWYVLIPVHVVTSIAWFGGFYYLSKSGVNVPALLEYIHLSESIIGRVQGSDMGHFAIAYLCYKVATPLRYALTLGGTTVSIKYLVQAGHIKPMPTKNEIIQLYEQKKADRAAAKADRENEQKKSDQNN